MARLCLLLCLFYRTMLMSQMLFFAVVVDSFGWSSIHIPSNSIRTSSFILQDSTPPLFDFSSRSLWEMYYAKNAPTMIDEWHSSVPLNIISDYVLDSETVQYRSENKHHENNILVLGCGTSHLPEALFALASTNPQPFPIKMTLLDSSPTCIKQLQQRYTGSSIDQALTFVCCDALQMAKSLILRQDVPTQQSSPPLSSSLFDVVVDKGLMDALLCGEGWNMTVERLLREVVGVLRTKGTYVLVSYRLSAATKKFLSNVGHEIGLTSWEFDCNGSNHRVSISTSRKV